MMQSSSTPKNLVVRQLRQEILAMQGYKKMIADDATDIGLGPVERAFPNKVFPVGAIHEFASQSIGNIAATNSFITGIIGKLMQKGGSCLWISTNRTVFPPALRLFGVDPERIIFADATRLKDALWTIEEALKCESLAAVVGELSELSFTESRRLQLAVEHSHVTGFIHRINPRRENTVACLTRWRIKPITSVTEPGFPGVGLPRWNVQLLKVRNGLPGIWDIEWTGEGFQYVNTTTTTATTPLVIKRKAG